MDYFIGIDIGTTHCKALVVDGQGNAISEHREGYPTGEPLPGYFEQDPEIIISSLWNVLGKALSAVPDLDALINISCSAAMHGLMVIDDQGVPLSPLITWADIRSSPQAANLRASALGDRIYARTGTPIHPMSPLCKIAWFREERPEIFQKAYKFVSIKEFWFQQLSGKYFVDYSLASATGLFDFRTLSWDPEALQWAGIGPNQLSLPVSPFEFFNWKIGPAHFPSLGKERLVPLILGGSDGWLATLGSGAVLAGEAALTIGTSGALRRLQLSTQTDRQQRLFSYAIDGSQYLSGGAVNNGGNILQWVLQAFGLADSSKDLNIFLEETTPIIPGAEGLICLPYVFGARAPLWNPQARGVYFGIQAGHSRRHFLKATLEGVCYSLFQVASAMQEKGEKLDRIYANGGFIGSPVWVQMLADILDCPLYLSHSGDASARGAIFLGMKKSGHIANWEDVKLFTGEVISVNPDPVRAQQYHQAREKYKQLEERLKDSFG